jgi:hypothetical protein
MASPTPRPHRSSLSARDPDALEPRDLWATRAVIFVMGLALVALGGWGLVQASQRTAAALGFGACIVMGALLVVFAALLPWLADGRVRIGPLTLTLQLSERAGQRSPRARRRRQRR